MAEPTISIIVPVYKTEAYLEKCVDSILAQTFRDFELLLIDDGSPDNCPALCEEGCLKDNFFREFLAFGQVNVNIVFVQ